MATKATDVDVSLFQVGRLEDSSTVSSQKIAWINYDTNKRKLHIQTPVFVTETYGIPRQGQRLDPNPGVSLCQCHLTGPLEHVFARRFPVHQIVSHKLQLPAGRAKLGL